MSQEPNTQDPALSMTCMTITNQQILSKNSCADPGPALRIAPSPIGFVAALGEVWDDT